jgi:shikimate dehydrogenase
MRAAQDLGFAGVNITHPFKQRIIPAVDEISPVAHSVGAVNTVVFAADGRTSGHNTDVAGFTGLIRRRVGDICGQRVVQVGAGGAGSAAAHALVTEGVSRLELRDLDAPRAVALAAAYPGGAVHGGGLDDLADLVAGADGVVNATFVGADGHPGVPLPVAMLRPGQWLLDVIYFPRRTQLVQEAAARGVRAFGGADMTVFQAIAGFELITGWVPDGDRMIAHMDALVR